MCRLGTGEGILEKAPAADESFPSFRILTPDPRERLLVPFLHCLLFELSLYSHPSPSSSFALPPHPPSFLSFRSFSYCLFEHLFPFLFLPQVSLLFRPSSLQTLLSSVPPGRCSNPNRSSISRTSLPSANSQSPARTSLFLVARRALSHQFGGNQNTAGSSLSLDFA